MKFLENLLKCKRKLVFFDLEGTQTTAEIIAIAAIKVTLDAKYNIKKIDEKGFKKYVKSQGSIGPVVTRLTGINEDLLNDLGISYQKAFDAFMTYVGKDINDCIFITYGNYDKKLLFQTCKVNDDYRIDDIKKITTNYADLSLFISRFMKDDKNNLLSLSECVEMLGGTFKGLKHDPMADTVNLVQVYDLFTKNKAAVKERYKHLISTDPKLPKPIANIIKKLDSGQNVSPKDFQQYIDDYLK
jgi:inhibitor of KinA sporulation pathway (predicted exonuclease)